MLKSCGWGGVVVVVVSHKILVSAPVPWIGDLGLGDWGLGLDNYKVSVPIGKLRMRGFQNTPDF